MRAQPICEQGSLIETALALLRWMQANGNDRVGTTFAEAFIVERCHQPARDQMAKVNLAAVFKIEDHVANDSAAAVSGNRGVEMEDAMGAVSAGKCGGDRAAERFRAFRAKRRHNSGNVSFTLVTKIFAQTDRCRANGARRRIEQRGDPAKKARCRERQHVSTSRALLATSSTRLQGARFRLTDFFQATAARSARAAQFC